VYYKVENYNTTPQKVGLRVMLDTYIGANDGVPFTIPGQKGFMKTKADFTGKDIPAYVEAVENPDNPKNLGTTVRLALKGLRLPGVLAEDPEKLRICRYPGNPNVGWDVGFQDPDSGKVVPQDIHLPGDPRNEGDSCVAIYWPYVTMEPKKERHLAFTYGLGELDVAGSLALSAPGTVQPNTEFVVTAYVWNSRAGQKVELDLPPGLTLADGERSEKEVDEGAARSQVFWKVRSGKEGTFTLKASSGKSKAKPRPVRVKAGTSIFG
jgi:hypothetical protein